MDIGRILKDSWAIFVKDWVVLIVAALITVVLSIFTLFILTIPLIAGLYLMIVRRVREGRKAEVGDVFGCFDRIGAYLLAFLVFLGIALCFAVVIGLPLGLLVIHNTGARAFGGFLTVLAVLAATVVGVYLETVWVYWTILMVDRRLSVIEALKESRVIVTRSGFWMTFLVVLIVGAIVGAINIALSTFTFGIGGFLSFVVLPWEFAALAAMYFQVTGEGGLLPSAFPGPSSAWQGGGAVAYGAPYAPPGYASPGYPPPGHPPTGYAPPPGYPPPAPPYGQPSPQALPPGYGQYGPPPGPPPGNAPPSPYGQPPAQASPWVTAPTTPPPWTQPPAADQAAPQSAPEATPQAPPAPGATPPTRRGQRRCRPTRWATRPTCLRPRPRRPRRRRPEAPEARVGAGRGQRRPAPTRGWATRPSIPAPPGLGRVILWPRRQSQGADMARASLRSWTGSTFVVAFATLRAGSAASTSRPASALDSHRC